MLGIIITIAAVAVVLLSLWLAQQAKEIDAISGVDAPENTLPAPESWKGRYVRVRFIKRDGQSRTMQDFIVLHISRYRSGKVLVHGLEATDQGWQPRGFCLDQLIDLRVNEQLTEKGLREAHALYRVLVNPNI
jgi:hypothetical protein